MAAVQVLNDDRSASGQAIGKLPPDQTTADLNEVAEHVAKLLASNGKVTIAGSCDGDRQSFGFATNCLSLAEAFVYYGTAPDNEGALPKMSCPV